MANLFDHHPLSNIYDNHDHITFALYQQFYPNTAIPDFEDSIMDYISDMIDIAQHIFNHFPQLVQLRDLIHQLNQLHDIIREANQITAHDLEQILEQVNAIDIQIDQINDDNADNNDPSRI